MLAPVAVWTTDEGMGGVAVHVANDRPVALNAELRVLLLRNGEQTVGEVQREVHLPAHGHGEWNLEGLLGRFVDASWAYRFGPPAQDAILVSLAGRKADGEPTQHISQAVRFPAGRPLEREDPQRIGLSGIARAVPGGELELSLSCRRLAYGVRIHAAGHRPADDCLTLEPGAARLVRLSPHGVAGTAPLPWLSALNMTGRVPVLIE